MKKLIAFFYRIGGPIASVFGMLIGVLLLRNDKLPAGLALIAAAGICFAWLALRAERHPIEGDPLPIATAGPAVLWLVSLGLALTIGMSLLPITRTTAGDRSNAASWIISLLCAAAATLWMNQARFPGRAAAKEWLRQNRIELASVSALVLVAFVMRWAFIVQHPYPWSGDEASIGMEARRILNGSISDLFNTSWSGQPNWSFVPNVLSILLVGDTIVSIRLVSALTGTLTVLTLYLFAREAFGQRTAFLAAAFLSAYPYHLHFSRVGVHNIMDGLAITAVLWLLLRAVRLGRPGDYAWPGLAAGLCIYTYVGTRLVPILAIAGIFLFIIFQRGYLRAHWRGLGMFALGGLVSAGPLSMFFARAPQQFMTRIAQEGILINGWLPRYAEVTGKTPAQVILDQVRLSVMVFIADGAPGNFYNTPQSYLTLLGSILLLFGMAYCLRRFLEPRHLLLLIWFWAVVTFGSILTLNPPANTRMVMTAPAVAALIAIGIVQSGELLKRLKILNERWATRLGLAVALILFAQNALFYFGDYWSHYRFQDANGELAMELGLEVQALGPEYDLYMIGHPRVYVGFPTIPYLAPENSRFDLRPEEAEVFELPPGEPTLIVATPEYRKLLEALARKYPGGTYYYVQRKTQPEVLYFGYRIDP